jgi:hypothetical protein
MEMQSMWSGMEWPKGGGYALAEDAYFTGTVLDPGQMGMAMALGAITRCSDCHEDFSQGDPFAVEVVENWHETISFAFLCARCADSRDTEDDPA